MRHTGDKALPAGRTPVMPDHLRCDRRLIDEDQARRIELGLLGYKLGARGGNVRTILLGGVQRFF